MDNSSNNQSETPLDLDPKARQRGRIGLMIPWQNVPWWGVIILIVGVVVGYSTLTDARYIDAITFIFDLPWNRESISRSVVGDDGQWQISVNDPMSPGDYNLFVQALDETNDPVGRTPIVQFTISETAESGTIGAHPPRRSDADD